MKMNPKPRRRIPSDCLRYSVIAMLLALSLTVAIPFDGSNTLAQSRRKPTPQSKRKPRQKPATPVKRNPLEIQLRNFEFETVTLNSRGEIINRRKGQARHYVEEINGVKLEMVEIPGGSFQMGRLSDYWFEQPVHKVDVPPFFFGKYEVTQAQWRAVAKLPKVRRNLNPNPSHFDGDGDNLPVEAVCWLDATEFCERLSRATGRIYRLPTEAEWEYACRAGTTTEYAFGDLITTAVVNYQDPPKRGRLKPIGFSGIANGFGLYDMHGNIQEWCLDYAHDSYEGAPADGRAWEEEGDGNKRSRVARGGNWKWSLDWCGSAVRRNYGWEIKSMEVGFRVVALTKTR